MDLITNEESWMEIRASRIQLLLPNQLSFLSAAQVA